MQSLKQAAADLVVSAEAVPKEVPQGNHQPNDEIKSAVREVKRQMRAVRLQLEKNLGRVPDEKGPILAWVPSFSADNMAMYKVGSDGKTAYERETGRKWAKQSLEFG